MAEERESDLRIALRHVQRGRECLKRQYEIIARLHAQGLPTVQAETVLDWLKETQLLFENDYKRLLDESQERLRRAGYEDPTADWPRD
jgi:hypothetical protein